MAAEGTGGSEAPAAAGDVGPLVLGPDDRADPPPPEAEAQAETATATEAPPVPKKRKSRRTRRKPRHQRSGLGGQLFLLALICTLAFTVYSLRGKSFELPDFAVAEVEARLNRALDGTLPEGALSIGGIEVMVSQDWVPRLVLEDLRLQKAGGTTLLTLPETHLTLDPDGLLQGAFRARDVRIVGARLQVRRDRDGHFDLTFAGGSGPEIDSLAALFDTADRVFARPGLRQLRSIELEALSLRLTDLSAGKSWEVGDGRLRFENRPDELAAQLGMSLVEGGSAPSRAVLTVVSAKGEGTARVTAQVDDLAAKDLASQTALLGFLGILEAQVSGRIAATVDAEGIKDLSGGLEIGKGALQPAEDTTPIAFDRASIGLGYDPDAGRILLTDLAVDSQTLRLKANGRAYMVDASGAAITGALSGRRPDAFLGQISISELKVDPAGLFDSPVTFSEGTLEARLKLQPFALDIGQVSLSREDERLLLKGAIRAEPGGWKTALDLELNHASLDGLLALWPKRMVPNTRSWVERNVRNAELQDVRASLRLVPGEAPKLDLGYNFAGAELRYMQKMPPVQAASGYAKIADNTYTLVLTQGMVTPPQGGRLDVTGSVFAVPDIRIIPAMGEVTYKARGPLTAMLSLLDQPPFHYLEKSRQPVTLGAGQVTVEARISLPLVQKVMPGDVTYSIAAEVLHFASDKVVPGHRVTAARLEVSADPTGLSISGLGKIGEVPFDATLRQDFGPTYPPARVTGQVTLSPEVVREFRLGLPESMVSGEGLGEVEITLPRDAVAKMRLTSDLKGVVLSLPELGWRKGAGEKGRLQADIAIGSPPQVTALTVEGAGLKAEGQVTLRPSGDFDLARFSNVTLGGWLDGAVEIRGRGNKPVALAVTSGSIDLRNFPEDRGSSGSAEGSPISARLDRLQVTESIALTGLQGEFSLSGGFNGDFTAQVNGQTPVSGTVVPSQYGSAVRIRSQDAGDAMRAAGLYSSAFGGTLEMTLVPRETSGQYSGTADLGSFRVRHGNVMADLLSSISIIGLLDQLNGAGIVFNSGQADFLLTPNAVELTKASAVGASMGVSMSGIYRSDLDQLDMSGVVSPVYLLNAVGELLTRKGEGLFGFAYRLRGSADAPEVSVNPLSILTPGMFRDLFRASPPKLPGEGG